jgi:DNA invertase Pin-like site-specific DNA recombinase
MRLKVLRRGRVYRHDEAGRRFILGVFAALAEFERELIRERTKAGMAAAKHRGRHVGKPHKPTPHQVNHARQLIADGSEKRAGGRYAVRRRSCHAAAGAEAA